MWFFFSACCPSSNKNQVNVVIRLVILAFFKKKKVISDALPVFSQYSNKVSKIEIMETLLGSPIVMYVQLLLSFSV